MSYNKKEIF